MASKADASDDARKVALCSSATAFALWGANNAYRAATKSTLQSKVDLAVTAGLFAVVVSALSSKK